jgi:hypothetical protein
MFAAANKPEIHKCFLLQTHFCICIVMRLCKQYNRMDEQGSVLDKGCGCVEAELESSKIPRVNGWSVTNLNLAMMLRIHRSSFSQRGE